MICWVKEKQMEGSFGWGWVVDLKFVFHLLKPINTAMKYFLLKVEISNPGVLKESIAKKIFSADLHELGHEKIKIKKFRK